MQTRNMLFILFSALTLLLFYAPLSEVSRLALHERLYAHMMFVPFVSAYFIFLKREQILLQAGYSFKAGIILLMIGVLVFWVGEENGWS